LLTLAAGGNDRATDPGDRLPAAQQASDHVGLIDLAARRMQIDRAPPVFHVPKETADPRGGVVIDIALNRNPAIATRSA